MSAYRGSDRLRTVGYGVNFVDNDGVPWSVTERDTHEVPGKRAERCLIFASSDAVRRVWQYPAGWRDLLTPSLIALSWTR
jgi:hypothetical protein